MTAPAAAFSISLLLAVLELACGDWIFGSIFACTAALALVIIAVERRGE